MCIICVRRSKIVYKTGVSNGVVNESFVFLPDLRVHVSLDDCCHQPVLLICYIVLLMNINCKTYFSGFGGFFLFHSGGVLKPFGGQSATPINANHIKKTIEMGKFGIHICLTIGIIKLLLFEGGYIRYQARKKIIRPVSKAVLKFNIAF